MTVHPILKEIATLFKSRDRQVYLVGGAVRDMLRGKKARDWDLATDAPPEEVMMLFQDACPRGRVIPTGIKHGTVTVHYRKHNMEITTFRTEANYSDSRRPDAVQYVASIEDDLSRRDFTMNAIALRLPDGEVVDPFGGTAAIKSRIIRCVGNALERFAEDGLRPLRALRFAAQLDFGLEQATLDAIPGALGVCAKVSAERVRDEIDRIITSALPSKAFVLMEKTGLLKLFLPELAACREIEQKGFHRFDVLDHSLLACDYAAREHYPHEVRLAALLHDIGKVPARRLDESGIWTFYQHEAISAQMAHTILSRLRYPNVMIDSVCHLIREHMFHYTEEWSDAAVRRFIVRVGGPNLENLYRLRRADSYAITKMEPAADSLLPLTWRVEKALAKSHTLSLKDLAVSGKDLIEAGIKPGKIMGIILNELFETVLDDPSENTRERLLRISGKMYEKLGE